jgi:hypothetical protein
MEVSRWLHELAKVTRVAICSGNHDNAGRQISADRAPIYEWLFELEKKPNIITDGMTQVVNDLIVTSVPYHSSKEQKSIWLDRGSTVRRQRGTPWIVLHYEPPWPTPVLPARNVRRRSFSATTGRNVSFPGTVINFRTWTEAVGSRSLTGVQVLVPGQLLDAAFPNHIFLDTESGELSWQTTSQEWIPDDLLSRFPPGINS